jgi:hypothetical protein
MKVVAPERVIEPALAGEVVDCGDGRGTVAAELLRTLCREHRDEVSLMGLLVGPTRLGD